MHEVGAPLLCPGSMHAAGSADKKTARPEACAHFSVGGRSLSANNQPAEQYAFVETVLMTNSRWDHASSETVNQAAVSQFANKG